MCFCLLCLLISIPAFGVMQSDPDLRHSYGMSTMLTMPLMKLLVKPTLCFSPSTPYITSGKINPCRSLWYQCLIFRG